MKRMKNRKINGASSKMDLTKKKPADYIELAYREAISKLKYLLAESYAPTGMFRTNSRFSESAEDTDDQSVISDDFRRNRSFAEKAVSSTFSPFPRTIQPSKVYSSVALSKADIQSAPPELTSFIKRQEDYIEQLERESQYCRDKLINLLSKVREVVAENEALHSRNQAVLSKCALQDHRDYCSVVRTDHREHAPASVCTIDNLESKREKSLERPSIMYESRISELEAQLTQARLELRKAQEENQVILKRLSETSSSEKSVEMKSELDKALRAKYEAEMKLEELRNLLSAAKDRETEASQRAKRSVDNRQQIEFERNQSEMEIRRLKDELEKQHEKLREATQEMNRRVIEERQHLERQYNQQIEQLTADIMSHWEAANKSQLESEKQRREINELRRELSQKQTVIDNLKKELQDKISKLQSDLNQAMSDKDAAEQEVLTSKLTAQQCERQARQEQKKSEAEINSYKQRLERTDADLVYCRRENLRLSEQIASLEKEININKIAHTEENNRNQNTPRLENEKELTSMIMDMETKHAATVTGLEDALNNQATLVSRLTAECQSLTQRLEANNLKHEKEMADLQTNIEHLSNKIQGTIASHEGGNLENTDESAVFHYNTALESAIPSQENGLPMSDQTSLKTHEGYDTANNHRLTEDSEMYSVIPTRNDQSQHDLYDSSYDQIHVTENNSVPNAVETEMYQQVGDATEESYANVNDPGMDTYMAEQEHNQYSEHA
ncbi:serologically defined colon cancer antigen 8 homolog isoform X2 [Pseudomyrmex gracilis]|uniref:serologically defined colon cancer antigen 8 homolog isoform X2 n=1 Tax=Pseudomyrmex gracilis TaxID=219809 RepID=UPI000994F10F|nr:serologically defined colon cancer antigen 8 homolog isoform X2 [Pseudomyrmex gracilis]